MAAFVLVHSPLVGPLTWGPVAEELRTQGIEAVVPPLNTDEAGARPFWKQHVNAVLGALAHLPADESLVLVGHSGGGVLLPAIGQAANRPITGYIFVDASIPRDGASRLDLFATPADAEAFRQMATDGYLPVWTEEDLEEVIPDRQLRGRFVSELRPLPLAVYEEPIPVVEGWPDAPCGYLSFTQTGAYEEPIRQAQQQGWAYAELDGAHFHMLVDPPAVAAALLDLASRNQESEEQSDI